MKPKIFIKFAMLAGVALWSVLAAPSWTSGSEAREYAEVSELANAMTTVLRASRTIISNKQKLINSEKPADKGLTGDVVVRLTEKAYREQTGQAWDQIAKTSRQYRYLNAYFQSIREVVDDNQPTINRPDVGFKGFVPAVFARLVNERFESKMGREVKVKVTAPLGLVRNLKARPDAFEIDATERFLSTSDWPRGDAYTAQEEASDTVRVMVPEYYKQGCMSCHGEPKGEIDITGYPKEGAKVGQLGGVISFQFFDERSRN